MCTQISTQCTVEPDRSMADSGKPEKKMEKVDLGFVDECDLRLLKSHHFPSKVGGKPAWLSLNPIPRPEDLSCPKCGSPQLFLLQVYAPRDSRDDTFHRIIFVFVCRNPACCVANSTENFRVFRSQLGRINDFFSSDPPPDDPEADEVGESNRPDAKNFQPLCAVCGCAGPKVCGRCHRQNYCSKEHQTIHWKAGHKTSCSTTISQAAGTEVDCHVLFPEAELTIDAEDLSVESTEESCQLPESSQADASNASAQYSNEELEQIARQETEDDKQFQKFKKRVAHEPDHVLRYCKGGQPLWVSAENKARTEDIPNCSCGAHREFEFQVMPQLLNYLGVDSTSASLDWGTLCVYTCSESCSIGNNYVPEIIWKQDFLAHQ